MSEFDGETFDPEFDGARLREEMRAVMVVMRDGQWRTFNEIADEIASFAGRRYGHPGISARLRDCRKYKYGSHTVERRRRGSPYDGLWEYRLLLNTQTEASVLALRGSDQRERAIGRLRDDPAGVRRVRPGRRGVRDTSRAERHRPGCAQPPGRVQWLTIRSSTSPIC